jgi:hypothetical protein
MNAASSRPLRSSAAGETTRKTARDHRSSGVAGRTSRPRVAATRWFLHGRGDRNRATARQSPPFRTSGDAAGRPPSVNGARGLESSSTAPPTSGGALPGMSAGRVRSARPTPARARLYSRPTRHRR